MNTHQEWPAPDSFLNDWMESFDYLAPHEFNRFETTDGFENIDFTNGIRTELAQQAMSRFQTVCNMEDEPDIVASDLICNLLHLVHASGYNSIDVLLRAITNFKAESGDPNRILG